MDYGPHSSQTWGKKPIGLKGPFESPQARCDPQMEFSEADRKWRNQWLKETHHLKNGDGTLDVTKNPEYFKARYNIFRRIWQTPMRTVENVLTPMVGEFRASLFRHCGTKAAQMLALGWFAAYYFKYKSDDWTRVQGWKGYYSKPAVYPGHPEWPCQTSAKKEKSDYWDMGFKKSGL